MYKRLTVSDIRYICRSMMGLDWLPSFIEIPDYLDNSRWRREWLEDQEYVLQILSQCQSKLEVMYFLGMCYYLHSNGVRRGGTSEDYPSFYRGSAENREGIHISEPFVGGKWGNGLSSLLVIPQYRSSEKPIHHDFGLFSGESNGGGPWHFFRAVEVEGYAVHRQRRRDDETRYEGLSYPIIRLYEETSSPLDWYQILDPDVRTGVMGEHCFEDHEGVEDDDLHAF